MDICTNAWDNWNFRNGNNITNTSKVTAFVILGYNFVFKTTIPPTTLGTIIYHHSVMCSFEIKQY